MKYILNTSFHIERALFDKGVAALRSRFVGAMESTGKVSGCRMMELLVDVDPAVRSLAVQFEAESLEDAVGAMDSAGLPAIQEVSRLLGGPQKMVWFTTPMRSI